MPSFVLRCEIVLPASIERVFRIFEDPYNLAEITPAGMRFQILTPNLQMRKGEEIDYKLHLRSIPLRWKTLITAYEPPYLFVDEALKSPYSYWRHWHRFRTTQQGTLVSDEVHYGMPFGPIGSLVHALSVRGQLLGIFRYRQLAVAKLLGVRPVKHGDPYVNPES